MDGKVEFLHIFTSCHQQIREGTLSRWHCFGDWKRHSQISLDGDGRTLVVPLSLVGGPSAMREGRRACFIRVALLHTFKSLSMKKGFMPPANSILLGTFVEFLLVWSHKADVGSQHSISIVAPPYMGRTRSRRRNNLLQCRARVQQFPSSSTTYVVLAPR